MFKNVIIAILAVALVGTGYWAYQEHGQRVAVLNAAENQYQRAYHNLTYQFDLLNDKIGTTLAMNTGKTLSPALSDVWRITSEAQNEIGLLPLSVVPINKTEEFLSDIGKFSYQTAVRDLEKEPLSDEEYKQLEDLYEQSGDIQNELRAIQYKVMKNNLRWSDVEAASASDEEPKDNTIMDGFSTVEKKVTGYSEASQFGPSHTANQQKDERYRNIKGENISKEKAVAIAKRFIDYDERAVVSVQESRKESDFPFYSVNLRDPDSDSELAIDITKAVGYPILLMNTRDVGEAKISLNKAGEIAKDFLKKQNYTSMELFESTQYDSVGLFNFVYTENGVRVYTDSIKVKVALDNGGVIGYSAEEYLKTNKERDLKEPKLSFEEVKSKVSPKLKIMENRLAVIADTRGEEVLCYEILGLLNDETYRIFVNADNGEEVLIEKMDESEPAYENL